MDNIQFEENIELRVFLLGIYKKQNDENMQDVINMMINSKVCDMKTAKKFIKNLKKLDYLKDESLTMMGLTKAKEVELEFKL
jgi:hypothetical protein